MQFELHVDEIVDDVWAAYEAATTGGNGPSSAQFNYKGWELKENKLLSFTTPSFRSLLGLLIKSDARSKAFMVVSKTAVDQGQQHRLKSFCSIETT